MADHTIITSARLREVLSYDPETGVFTWAKMIGQRCTIGTRAGILYRDRRPRRSIAIDGRRYQEHNLAWLYITGEFPAAEVDHINNDATDNRWANLRLATRAQNTQNARRRQDNTTGFKGVCLHEGRYAARIQVNKKRIFLGHFDTPEEAYAARCKAAQEYHGEFSNPG